MKAGRHTIPVALRNNSLFEILGALGAIDDFDLIPKYLDDVSALLEYPDGQVAGKAFCLLVRMAARKEGGKAREVLARYFLANLDLSLVKIYFADRGMIDENILDALMKFCVVKGEKAARYIIREIAKRANSDPEVAKLVLAYQPPNEKRRKYHRRLIRRLRIQMTGDAEK